MATMDFEFRFSARGSGGPRPSGGAMRLAVIGDFSGRGKGRDAWPHPVAVDLDRFDEVMTRMSPRLESSASGQTVEFLELEDFHPDALFRRLDPFAKLRDLRRRLADTSTFDAAAAELRARAAHLAEVTPAPVAPATGAEETDDATLSRLLGAQPHDGAVTSGASVANDLIRDLVAPYVMPAPDPRQDLYLQATDEAIAGEMRTLLHHPSFRALECRWLGLRRLVFDEVAADAVKIHLLDLDLDTVREDLAAAGNELSASRLAPLLLEPGSGPGEEPWSAIIADFYLGASVEDASLLGKLGALAAAAGAPLIAGARPSLLGHASIAGSTDPGEWRDLDDDVAGAWAGLRASPQARWLGLAFPRLLQRLPYGARGDAVDGFEFEELAPGSDHESYAWGNGAFGCATLLARAFARAGWSMSPGDVLDVDELPAYSHVVEGEARLVPPAEVFLSERAGAALIERGLMPFLSYRDRGSARLLRFQSLAAPAAALAGPWGQG